MEKQFIKLAFVTAAVGGLFGTPLEAQPGKKVDACHFGGHQTEFRERTYHDFEVRKGGVKKCQILGGEVISISENALQAHGIDGRIEEPIKVDVCHFGGHKTEFKGRTRYDYVTSPRGDRKCDSLGGEVISISENALSAHGIDSITLPH